MIKDTLLTLLTARSLGPLGECKWGREIVGYDS